MYTENYKIRYSEIDYKLTVKPSSLLQLMQEIASENAENLGFGYSFLTQKKLGWFLLKYHIEFEKYPSNINSLTIKTEPRGYNKLFAFRDFEIYNNETQLGRATTTWGLIDLTTKNMTNVQESLKDNGYMKPFARKENDLSYNKIQPIEKIDCEKKFEIRYDDLDVNKHANNSNYIIWALETLNFDFRAKNNIKTIDMLFKKEVGFDSVVASQVEIKNNITKHRLYNLKTNEDLCLIQIEWS